MVLHTDDRRQSVYKSETPVKASHHDLNAPSRIIVCKSKQRSQDCLTLGSTFRRNREPWPFPRLPAITLDFSVRLSP